MGLRIALLSYRSKPYSGGQGIYVRHLSRELAAAGHDVTVVSGPPYPDLDDVPGLRLVRLPSLDLYREPDPFRVPGLREFRDGVDVLEFAGMCTAAFPEPLTFSLRALRWLRTHAGEFDVVHDNQGLGYGMLGVPRLGLPLVTTIHHPITRDRLTDLAAARGVRRLTVRRWYSFLAMQARVARAQTHVVTVSTSSARDIVADFGVDPAAISVVPLGVETDVFAPPAAGFASRVEGRIVSMASADTPLKGVDTLLEAVARVRRARPGPLELVLVTQPGGATERLVHRLGLADVVRFVHGLSDAELAQLMGSARVFAVPSRYEGFSLPTLEAMACGTPLVVTRAGAIPEVVGQEEPVGVGHPRVACAEVVAPDRPAELADALLGVLGDPQRAATMGEAGRDRAVARFSWPAVARATAEVYLAACGCDPLTSAAPNAARSSPAPERRHDQAAPVRTTRQPTTDDPTTDDLAQAPAGDAA